MPLAWLPGFFLVLVMPATRVWYLKHLAFESWKYSLTEGCSKITFPLGRMGGIPGPSCREQLNILLFTQAQRSVKLTLYYPHWMGHLSSQPLGSFMQPIQATGAQILREEKMNIFCYPWEAHCSLGIDLPWKAQWTEHLCFWIWPQKDSLLVLVWP